MPLGQNGSGWLKLTQMQTKMFFKQNLTNDSCKQIEKTQGQTVGTKMGSIAGNDQNTLLYDFMQKI